MAESSLSLSLVDLQAEVGHYRGFGRDYDAMTSDQQFEVDSIIKGGLRLFYGAYDWSFLKPLASLLTVSGTWEYELPAEYGGMDGDLTFVTSSTRYHRIPVTLETRIRDLRQSRPGQTGPPQLAAIRPLAIEAGTGQRFQLLLWPTPDAVYNLEYRFTVNPQALSNIKPFPYGGMPHAETILAACLSVAESRYEDGGTGVQTARYQNLLAESVASDGRRHRADRLGYNGDRSDLRGDLPTRRRQPGLIVTYNGQEY